MTRVTSKTAAGTVDGTPVKRMFWSIISDYDLRTGICELVDNAIDLGLKRGRIDRLKIKVELDAERQLISVADNAGGVGLPNLDLLVVPGGSGNSPEAEVIGIFGVGSKRAGIALGERVEVRTHARGNPTYELEITKDWLATDDWNLPIFEVPDIAVGTTETNISHLRRPFTKDARDALIEHLGQTYSWFIGKGLSLSVNDTVVEPIGFDTWAYPPSYEPRSVNFNVNLGSSGTVSANITAGLIRDRDPERENYGVYCYCNHRLIIKELRTREVGYFVSAQAGVPHPDASLCRAIVSLQGPAQTMPWNSSKSGLDYSHPLFDALRANLIPMVSFYSSLSRRLKTDWQGRVFRYSAGQSNEIEPVLSAGRARLLLPPLPKVNKSRLEQLKAKNRAISEKLPWTLGLIEAIGVVDIIARQGLETGNRIALILLDSNFEIGLKEFIVHRQDVFPPSQYNNSVVQKLFSRRTDVIQEVLAKGIVIPQELIDKANHYYALRNKMIHERATAEVTDADIKIYRTTVERVLAILFGLKWRM